MIANNVIIPFDGNHDSVPSGYSRETSLDGKYPKGTANSTNPNVTGGSATHAHTSSSHTHTMAAHTHTYSMAASSTTQSDGHDAAGSVISNASHTHTGTSGAISGGSLSGAATIGNGDNNPAFYTVIFIKSSGYNVIPTSGMVLNASTSRSGMDFHEASAGKFLKGAAAEANAGGTGGTATHTHTYNHGHSAAAHTHSGANSGAANNSLDRPGSGNSLNAAAGHTHSVTLNSQNTSVNDTNSSFTSGTVEPAFRTLNLFKASSSVVPQPGDIGMWLGTLATIPLGWKLCDGTNDTPDMRDRFFKVPSTASETTTGGSNTHTHTNVASHTHTATGTHNHTGSCATGAGAHQNGGGYPRSSATHTHTVSSVSSVTATWNNTTISTNTPNNEPEYRTVAYIQFEYAPVIPNPIIGMLIDRL